MQGHAASGSHRARSYFPGIMGRDKRRDDGVMERGPKCVMRSCLPCYRVRSGNTPTADTTAGTTAGMSLLMRLTRCCWCVATWPGEWNTPWQIHANLPHIDVHQDGRRGVMGGIVGSTDGRSWLGSLCRMMNSDMGERWRRMRRTKRRRRRMRRRRRRSYDRHSRPAQVAAKA